MGENTKRVNKEKFTIMLSVLLCIVITVLTSSYIIFYELREQLQQNMEDVAQNMEDEKIEKSDCVVGSSVDVCGYSSVRCGKSGGFVCSGPGESLY